MAPTRLVSEILLSDVLAFFLRPELAKYTSHIRTSVQ